MKFTGNKELLCSWELIQLHKAMSQAGFSPGIPPAVRCYSTVFTEYLGSLCRKKGALLVLGEHSSIERPVFSSEEQSGQPWSTEECDWRKAGQWSACAVWPFFGHQASRAQKICAGSWLDPLAEHEMREAEEVEQSHFPITSSPK